MIDKLREFCGTTSKYEYENYPTSYTITGNNKTDLINEIGIRLNIIHQEEVENCDIDERKHR